MFTYINGLVQKIKSSEKGQGMVEYALIIAFVAAIAIWAFSDDGVGSAITDAFTNAGSMVQGANDAAESMSNGSN